MRRTPRQRMTAIIGIFTIAVLVGATLGARVIAAQEETPAASTQEEVTAVPGGAAPVDIATPSDTDTDQASETPPATDDENGDPDEGEEDPAPSEAPMPSAEPSSTGQPVSTPDAGTSDGDAWDQPAPSPSPLSSPPAATPAAEASLAVATPATDSCQTGELAPPDVQVSGTGFGPPEIDGTSYTPVTTTIVITLKLPDSGACLPPNWHVAMTASAMQPAGDGTSPAGAITYQGISELTAPDLAGAGLAPGASLATGQTIVTGTNQTFDETQPSLTFTVALSWSPPANAAAGQYVSRVTVTSIAGKGG